MNEPAALVGQPAPRGGKADDTAGLLHDLGNQVEFAAIKAAHAVAVEDAVHIEDQGFHWRKGMVKVIGATLRGAGARLSAKTASSTVCMLCDDWCFCGVRDTGTAVTAVVFIGNEAHRFAGMSADMAGQADGP